MSTTESTRPQWQQDLLYIVGLLAGTYAVFILIGLLFGVGTNQMAGVLQRVTLFGATFAMLTLALNLHWGYTGMFNIGIAGFIAIGMYAMAVLTAAPDGTPAGFGLPVWVGVIGGTIAAGIAGSIMALPALRVRADYFAIITLGFSEIVRLSVTSGSLRQIPVGDRVYGTGGGNGIGYTAVDSVVPWLLDLPGIGLIGNGIIAGVGSLGISASVAERVIYTGLLIGFVLLFYLLLDRIGRSPFGRILKAIREDEMAARSLGKNTEYAKIKIFALGAALMGLAGILRYGRFSSTSPEQYLPIVTFYVFVALIIGGAGSNTGSVVGGFVFGAFLWEGPRFLRTVLRTNLNIQSPETIYEAILTTGSEPLALIGYLIGSLDVLRWIVIGVILILLMVYRPQGLFGDRKEIAAAVDLSKRRATTDGETNE